MVIGLLNVENKNTRTAADGHFRLVLPPAGSVPADFPDNHRLSRVRARDPVSIDLHRMTEPLHFMMGRYKAVIPADRSYSPRHLWLQPAADRIYRVGLTAWSVRLLQDVYFLEWSVDEGAAVREKQEIGEIESSKALSSLYPPYAGRILKFNELILKDPSAINADGYGAGWLYEFETETVPLTATEYIEVLEAGWEKTQRTIKGQLND